MKLSSILYYNYIVIKKKLIISRVRVYEEAPLRKPDGRMLCGDKGDAAGRMEGSIGGSDGRKYLPP